MTNRGEPDAGAENVPVIDLSVAPGERAKWGRPPFIVYLWAVVELLLITNPWQVSSSLRVAVLRLFGAKIGEGVIFRPRTRVKFPWKLAIGDRSWIGEGVWFHNQDFVSVGSDVVISQETLLTTGSHRPNKDMALVTLPIRIEDGAWITARCLVTGGVVIGKSAMIRPMTPVHQDVPANAVAASSAIKFVGKRFSGAEVSVRLDGEDREQA